MKKFTWGYFLRLSNSLDTHICRQFLVESLQVARIRRRPSRTSSEKSSKTATKEKTCHKTLVRKHNKTNLRTPLSIGDLLKVRQWRENWRSVKRNLVHLPEHWLQLIICRNRQCILVLLPPRIVSSWSSRSVMWDDIWLKLSMARSLTSSISSLNISTRKSRHRTANSGLLRERAQMASTVAWRTSRNSSSRPCTNAPHAPDDIRLIWSASIFCHAREINNNYSVSL